MYSIFGTGRAAGNLIGVLLNLAALLLIALGLKNFGSRWGALLFMMLAGINFTLIHFARTPFLEASQNFWLAAAFYLFSLGSKRIWFFLAAGAAAAAAAFFGKALALFGIGIFLGALLIIWLKESKSRRQTFTKALLFCLGYGGVALGWYLFAYLPSAEKFQEYLLEQGLGLYGSPRAFEAWNWFVVQLNWFLYERNFLGKLPFVTVLGVIGGAVLIYRVLRRPHKKDKTVFNQGWLLLFVWSAVAFLALFPHNYRPLRYQTTLMLPLLGLAGLLLGNWLRGLIEPPESSGKKAKINRYLLAASCGLWLMPVLASAFLYLKAFEGLPAAFNFAIDNAFWIAGATFGIGFLGALGLSFLLKIKLNWRPLGGILAILVLISYSAVHISMYAEWVDTRVYTLVTTDRDLGALLAKDAVVAGSYATALTQENRLGCVHHMFGKKAEYVDPEFFKRFPITHLVIDEGNENRARQDYPEVMSQAHLLATYNIRGYDVKLLRVAPAAGSQHALRYRPTDFELARYWLEAQNPDSALYYLDRYLARGIPNFSADLALGTSYLSEGHANVALTHLLKVVDFAPRNVLARLYLGYAYLGAAASELQVAYYDSAYVHLKYCRKFITREQDQDLAKTVDQLEKR